MPRLPLSLARPFLQQVRELPKPGKTSRAARKRFTALTDPLNKGVYVHSQQGAAHFNTKKTASRRTRLKRDAYLSPSDRRRILTLLGK